MVEPKTVAKTVLVPNPTRAGKPARPSAILVGATGRPDAKGIIAPFPGAPVGPVGPVGAFIIGNSKTDQDKGKIKYELSHYAGYHP